MVLADLPGLGVLSSDLIQRKKGLDHLVTVE